MKRFCISAVRILLGVLLLGGIVFCSVIGAWLALPGLLLVAGIAHVELDNL